MYKCHEERGSFGKNVNDNSNYFIKRKLHNHIVKIGSPNLNDKSNYFIKQQIHKHIVKIG